MASPAGQDLLVGSELGHYRILEIPPTGRRTGAAVGSARSLQVTTIQVHPRMVMNFTKGSFTLVVFAALIAAVPAASAATCSNATLKGVYGVLSSGLNGSGQPASSVDRVVTDGAGNLSGSSTKSKD